MSASLQSSSSTQQSAASSSPGAKPGAHRNKRSATLKLALAYGILSMWIVLRWILICFATVVFLLLAKTIALLESIGKAYIRAHGGEVDSETDATTR